MTLKNFFKSKYFLYLLLSLPSIPLFIGMASYPWTEEIYGQLTHSSGETAIRLLILTLLISPLKLIFPQNRFWKWMMQHRRYFGVSAFLYAILHLLIYLIYTAELAKILSDFAVLTYLFGWCGFLVLIPLAATSTHAAIKKMGGNAWKKLHRLVYAVALLSALHWLFKEKGEVAPVLVHFVPLVLLEWYRIYRYFNDKRQA